jgi:quinoprotein dehydrogenase-associated probable ABC transporter substrate-binding protein
VKRAAWLLVALCANAFAADPLRVCADPDNLPYSRADGSGFENRIAQLVAADLNRPLEYAWLPDVRGFVRKTLGAQLCDVIIGVPADFERTANTRPYYRSTYVIVQRASDAPVRSFDDPRLATLRVGVQLIGNDLAASPPGGLLARRGHTQNVRGFPVVGDEPSAQRAVEALERGEIDAAVLWGPQAGWFARRSGVPLRVAALPAPDDAHFEYAIAMGVRRSDSALRDQLDEVIRRRHAEITRILAEYSVPRVEEVR